MNSAPFTLRNWMLGISLVIISGCTFRPKVISAGVKLFEENAVVTVKLLTSDASTIKSRQIYFSMVIVECDKNDNRYPIEPYFETQRASDFIFPLKDEYLEFSGSMPLSLFEQYRHPCVFLEGGSIFFGEIESDSIPIQNIDKELL